MMLHQISSIDDNRDAFAEKLLNKTMASIKQPMALLRAVGRISEKPLAQGIALHN
jgi:hypothetical protein